MQITVKGLVFRMDTTLIQQFPYVGLFVLLVLGVIGFPFPEDAILILCGFLIAHRVVEPTPALLVVASGMVVTDYFLYHVGRKYGRKVVAHKRFRKIMSARREARLESTFNRWGVLVIFLGRHLVGLRSQIFLVAGILRMPRSRFILADTVSSMLTIAIMAGAGFWGGSTLELIKKDVEEAQKAIMILIAIIAVALLVWLLAVRKIRGDGDGNDEG
ncbi:MAG TPA: DedA family protein [Dissulfurispiraceae bacterium]|nr:DedA family protein [Dissulfurispiraceae bacterium]